jgi:hypothetical protein
MKFALTELFKIAADPFRNRTSIDNTSFVAPVKATARVVGVIQPSFIQKWFTFRVIDPNKNPLANMALGLVTEKLIDTVIPFLARGLWKVVTILPGKVKFAVSGTLTVVTAVNYVLRTVIPTGLLSTLTEFPRTVKATVESVQQTITNSAVVTNTVKELAGTVKMYTSTSTTPVPSGASIPPKIEAISSPASPLAAETVSKVTEAVVGHSWLYYTCVGSAIIVVGGLTYYYGMNYYHGTSSNVHILTPPGKGGVSFGFVQQKSYPLYEPLNYVINSIGHWADIGIGKVLGGLTFLGVPALGYFRLDKHPQAQLWLPRFIKDIPPLSEANLVSVVYPDPAPFINGNIKPENVRIDIETAPVGVVRLPDSLINASAQAKAKYLAEKKLEDLDLEEVPEFSVDATDNILNNLKLEEMEKIMTSPKYLEWQSEPEKIAAALEQIFQSSDRLAAIVQVFGCF